MFWVNQNISTGANYWFASAQLLATLIVSRRECLFVGSRALALADPYCHIAWNSVGVFVGLFVRNFEVKYLGNQRS